MSFVGEHMQLETGMLDNVGHSQENTIMWFLSIVALDFM